MTLGLARALAKILHVSLGSQSTAKISDIDRGDSPLALVCPSCRAGPFSYKGFREAVRKSDGGPPGYCYTTTWGRIADSISNEACNWCSIVRRTKDELPPDKLPTPGEENVKIRFLVSTWSSSVNKLEIHLNDFMAATYTIYAKPDDSAIREIGPEIVYFHKRSYLDYSRTLERIKECGNHEHCPAIEETFLPSRVIDCLDLSKIRLVETHRQIQDHYCALSYVWGGNQHQKLTTSNIDTYVREGINIPLPQTIADAIFVTNKLGIQYLWVDALCIIQDSNEDKVNELGMMAHIYRNAYLTIAVESACRADQGFLPDKRAPDILPFYLADKCISPSRMILEYRLEEGHLYLRERGWCFQESLLSPRKLTLRPPDAWYQCRSFGQRDLGRNASDRPGPPTDDYILFPTNKNHAGRNTGREVGEQELRERWRHMLGEYSFRKIRFSSDKLPALASLAEVFQALRKDQYLAGLWRRSLLDDLLWEVWCSMGPDAVPLPRPPGYRAPTWSWASVDGALDFSYAREAPASVTSYEAEIVTCEVTLKDSTLPFGKVTGGRLTMRVKMHSLMRDGRKCAFIERKGIIEKYGNTTQWSWTPPAGNCFEPGVFSIGGASDDEERMGKPIIGYIAFDCLEGTGQDYQDFYVVILRAGRNRETWDPNKGWMQGLIVLRIDGEVDQYARVAKLQLNRDFEWLEWFDAMPLKTVTLV